MQFKLLILIWLFYCGNICSQHKIINQFKDFAANADMACYEQKIQQDLNKFDKWLVDSLPVLKGPLSPWYRPGNVNLQKENKIFALAVSLINTDNYNFEDNIYDYLIIDSLRTFIAICIDSKMNVTGITDTGEPGTFVDLKDYFYYEKIHRDRIRESIKNIIKKNPDLILYCEDWYCSILYIKDEKIYVYDNKKRTGQEFNENVRECLDIIRRSNKILMPYSKIFNDDRNLYRFTGHTPPNEARICSPLSKER